MTNQIQSSTLLLETERKPKEEIINVYKAFFNGKTTTVEADSLYAAKLKAIEELKPKKREESLLAIVPLMINGKEYEYPTTF